MLTDDELFYRLARPKGTLEPSVLEAMHFDAVLIIFPEHIATGVDLPGASGTYFELDCSHYFHCETTGTGWDVGEVLMM